MLVYLNTKCKNPHYSTMYCVLPSYLLLYIIKSKGYAFEEVYSGWKLSLFVQTNKSGISSTMM